MYRLCYKTSNYAKKNPPNCPFKLHFMALIYIGNTLRLNTESKFSISSIKIQINAVKFTLMHVSVLPKFTPFALIWTYVWLKNCLNNKYLSISGVCLCQFRGVWDKKKSLRTTGSTSQNNVLWTKTLVRCWSKGEKTKVLCWYWTVFAV